MPALFNKLSFKQLVPCRGNKPLKDSFIFPPLCLCVFTPFCFALLSFLLGSAHKKSASPQTHKTSPRFYGCVICFSFVDVGLFHSLPTTNKHGKWESGEKTGAGPVLLLYSSFCVLQRSQEFLSSPRPFFLEHLVALFTLSLRELLCSDCR